MNLDDLLKKDKLKICFQGQITLWPSTFKDADNLLEIAGQHSEKSKLLSACACIVMTAALDQATWAKIELITQNEADPKVLPEKYADLLVKGKGSLVRRLYAIPDLLTEGQLLLDKNSTHVKSLHSLIRFRNELVHVREGMIEAEIEVPTDEFKKGNIPLQIEPPRYLWDSVSLKEARSFRDSVGVYLRDVIDLDEIKPGMIIKQVR